MPGLLAYILFSIVYLFAGAITVNYVWQMMQPDGAFDVMFNWQRMLDKLYGKSAENKWARWAHDALGGCSKCTSYWFMPLWFIGYYIISRYCFDMWITDNVERLWVAVIANLYWFTAFWNLGGWLGLFIIVKNKQNGV